MGRSYNIHQPTTSLLALALEVGGRRAVLLLLLLQGLMSSLTLERNRQGSAHLEIQGLFGASSGFGARGSGL